MTDEVPQGQLRPVRLHIERIGSTDAQTGDQPQRGDDAADFRPRRLLTAVAQSPQMPLADAFTAARARQTFRGTDHADRLDVQQLKKPFQLRGQFTFSLAHCW